MNRNVDEAKKKSYERYSIVFVLGFFSLNIAASRKPDA